MVELTPTQRNQLHLLQTVPALTSVGMIFEYRLGWDFYHDNDD
jgi:hypothetical protein